MAAAGHIQIGPKQVLQEKEASFLLSRKSFLLSWNFKISEGMKGHGGNEGRGESRLVKREGQWGVRKVEGEERPKGNGSRKEAAQELKVRMKWVGHGTYMGGQGPAEGSCFSHSILFISLCLSGKGF